ncbi:restriction endonuclease type II-like protein [Hygrophoropsis aurantiaca]|uniref:Restriction endonuclease type II-like protein n=1 Tax=Hygrophoropsis aurantiaca TaxID=72124 RepID=A0ACB8ALV1_9AGAM|nr:restriction endonuclease type II-like protein [Hygrophoropsis aurantiaca]
MSVPSIDPKPGIPPKAKPPVVQPGSGNNIIINPNQRKNPLLDCIRDVGKEFGDIVPDFQVGRTTCALFLSLKYHRLHPEYIHTRIEKLGHSYNLRILLILCDVSESQELIRELTKVCLINNMTIIVAWSNEEAGQYLATYKQFEHKPPDLIKERVDQDYDSLLRTALTSISKVNKTDVETLRTSLGSFADIARTPADRLQKLPGFGPVKVRRIKEAFEKPFRNKITSSTLSLTQRDVPQGGNPDTNASTSIKDKGKGREIAPTATSAPSSSLPQPPSPVWDIELDLDDPLPTSTSDRQRPLLEEPQWGSQAPTPTRPRRSPSPVWDIELDLNDEDIAEGNENGDGFGSPQNLL